MHVHENTSDVLTDAQWILLDLTHLSGFNWQPNIWLTDMTSSWSVPLHLSPVVFLLWFKGYDWLYFIYNCMNWYKLEFQSQWDKRLVHCSYVLIWESYTNQVENKWGNERKKKGRRERKRDKKAEIKEGKKHRGKLKEREGREEKKGKNEGGK